MEDGRQNIQIGKTEESHEPPSITVSRERIKHEVVISRYRVSMDSDKLFRFIWIC